jgi:hypothetical protein
MPTNISLVRQTVQQLLRDNYNGQDKPDFETGELDTIIGQVVSEVSAASPYKTVYPLLVTANSKKLDISGLSDVLDIRYVEYEVGQDPETRRGIEYLDNETIAMKLTSAPTTTGTSGTLAGTVTFTAGSTTVTGSGTAFSTVLDTDYFIKPSSKSRWYRVYSVESATSLTLDEPVKTGDAGADTVSLTQYRYGVALLHYEKKHTLDEDESTFNFKEEKVLVDGIVANAALNWIGHLRKQVSEAITLIADIHSTVKKTSGQLNAAIADLTKSRSLIDAHKTETLTKITASASMLIQATADLNRTKSYIGDHKTEILAKITAAEKRINQAVADLNRARPLINKVNDSASPENDLGATAGRELSIANTELNTAQTYSAVDRAEMERANIAARELSIANTDLNIASEYMAVDNAEMRRLNLASQEIAAGNTYLNQSGGYARELNSRLSIASTINSFSTWAERKLALYRQELDALRPIKTVRMYSED